VRVRRSEAGVTLVELLVVVAISGLVIPVLTGALVLGWRTTDATIASLGDSRNRQLAPSLFTRDAQNALTVDTTAADTTCVSAGDTLLVRMRWTETAVSGVAANRVAAWVLTTGVERLLERRYCGTGTTLTGSVTASHGVVGTPTVTCRSAAGASVACSAAVTVSLDITDATGTFQANGRRRTP
jgi:prepilin-type N-terminal cleavage/methylation domain-containing protein